MHKSTFAVSLLVVFHLFAARVDAQGWVDVSDPNNTPGTTNRSGMCFYPPGNYCLLVRGTETWKYDTQGWQQLAPNTAPVGVGNNPSGVYGSRIVCQPITGRTVLAQLYTVQATSSGDRDHRVAMYEWDGQDWIVGPVSPSIYRTCCNSSPATYVTARLAADSSAIYLITNGTCYGNNCQFLTGTRQYEVTPSTTLGTGTLNQIVPLVMPQVTFAAEFRTYYDAQMDQISLIAADPPSQWTFNSSTQNWSQCFPSYLGHPITSGDFGPIAFSDTNNVGIGLGVDLPYTTRTLEYSGCEIGIQFLPTQPAVRTGYSIAYDSSRSRFVLHGGSGYADTWELELGPLATYTTTGTGCVGTGGTPTLQAANGSLPVAGSQFNVQVSGMPWNTPAFMFMGTSNTSYGGAPLPFDLAPIGAPGCILRAPGTFLFGVPNVLGTGLWNYSIPYLPGQVFYNQAIIFDPAANSLGLTVSNVGEAVIGS